VLRLVRLDEEDDLCFFNGGRALGVGGRGFDGKGEGCAALGGAFLCFSSEEEELRLELDDRLELTDRLDDFALVFVTVADFAGGGGRAEFFTFESSTSISSLLELEIELEELDDDFLRFKVDFTGGTGGKAAG
jgi:hypothetical protein